MNNILWTVFHSLSTNIFNYFFGTAVSICINLIIILLFCLGIRILRKSRQMVLYENSVLDLIKAQFKDAIKAKKSVEDFFAQSDFDNNSKISAAIIDARKSADNPVIMDEYVRSACPNRTTWGKFFSGILIIFGLIGTILGLSEAILEMQDILSGMDQVNRNAFQGIIQKILNSLGFMKTAFSTTLCGFMLFILLSFYDHYYQTSYDNFVKDLDYFISNLMIPYFTPEKAETNLSDISKTLQVSVKDFIHVSESISDLTTKVMENQEVFLSLGQDLKNIVADTAYSQKNLEQSYQNIEQLTERYVNHSESLGRQVVKNQEITESLFKNLGTDKNHIEKLYIKMDDTIQKLNNNFSEELMSLKRAIRNAVDVQNQKIELIEKDHDTYVRKTTEKLGKMINAAKTVMESHKKTYEEDLKLAQQKQQKAIESSSDLHIDKMTQTIETVFKMQRDTQQKEMILVTRKIESLIDAVKTQQLNFMNIIQKENKPRNIEKPSKPSKKGFFFNKSTKKAEKENQKLEIEDNPYDESDPYEDMEPYFEKEIKIV